jgi:hypothetical protein
MEQATNDPPKRLPHGGDTRTPQAKMEVARREQQIVALRLRGVPFFEIGRVIGIGRVAAFRAFKRALHRNTDQDLQSHHCTELAKLDIEEANIWRAMDANKENWRVQMSGSAQLRGIHIRRAKLLGLDSPSKLDVRALYSAGTDEASEESLENQRAWARLSLDEQERFYEALTRPALETTATVTTLGPDTPNDDDDSAGQTED